MSEEGKAAFAAAVLAGAPEADAPEYRKFLDESHEQWIDLAAVPAPISGRRYKQLGVYNALRAEDTGWMFEWAAKSLRAVHLRDDNGALIDKVPAAADMDTLSVVALRFMFQQLGVLLFTTPLPTG
jgi:hypothetical protein